MSVGVEDWGKVLYAKLPDGNESTIYLVDAWEDCTHIRAKYRREDELRSFLLPKDFAPAYQASDLDEMVYRGFSEKSA